MDPDDTVDHHGPDIGITFSERSLERHSAVIEDLKIGDEIQFNATLISLGDRRHLHQLRAFDIKRLPGHKDVWAAVNGKGRYKLKIDHLKADDLENKAIQ